MSVSMQSSSCSSQAVVAVNLLSLSSCHSSQVVIAVKLSWKSKLQWKSHCHGSQAIIAVLAFKLSWHSSCHSSQSHLWYTFVLVYLLHSLWCDKWQYRGHVGRWWTLHWTLDPVWQHLQCCFNLFRHSAYLHSHFTTNLLLNLHPNNEI